MGLFINNQEHPEVYKNNCGIEGTNQVSFKSDFLTELAKEQERANKSLQHSFRQVQQLYEQQEHTSSSRWNELEHYLHELKAISQEHEKSENHVLEMIEKLDAQHEKLLGNDADLNHELLEQINRINQSNQEVVTRLEKYDSANEEIISTMNEQLKSQKNLTEQMVKQDERQEIVASRLENQEAITEKIVREMNNIRSVLFERTSYLAEEIENGYKLTSSYIYKLMTKADQPLTLLMENEQKEKVQKK